MPADQRLAGTELREISASSASVPPSPLLSARMMTVTYLSVTTSIIDQNIRLSAPRMCGLSSASEMMAGEGFAERVERAGADIAEDDADRAHRELQHALLAMMMAIARRSDGAIAR